MKYHYMVHLQEEDDRYIGDIELDQPLINKQGGMVVINEDLYAISHIGIIPRGKQLYVSKVQRAELNNTEAAFDVLTKSLGDIMTFLNTYNVQSFYSKNRVQLKYSYSYLKDKHKDFIAVGENLTEALVALRNEMIRREIIKRGEW